MVNYSINVSKRDIRLSHQKNKTTINADENFLECYENYITGVYFACFCNFLDYILELVFRFFNAAKQKRVLFNIPYHGPKELW